jgi:hypothetical protein
MFCDNCGSLIRPRANYCRHCGYSFNLQAPLVVNYANQPGSSTALQIMGHPYTISLFGVPTFFQLQPPSRMDAGLLLIEGRIKLLKSTWPYTDTATVDKNVMGYGNMLEALYMDACFDGLDIAPYRPRIQVLQQTLADIAANAAKSHAQERQALSIRLSRLDAWTQYLVESVPSSGTSMLKASLDHCRLELQEVLQTLQQFPVDLGPGSPYYLTITNIQRRLLEAEHEIKRKAAGKAAMWQGVVKLASEVVGLIIGLRNWFP